ncbi:MAG: hypothetical protein JXQ83_13550 [Candidatus Glassbacteria bacterium]|nr:hypothetical protein [Candidatus Glassbacteria bacterium]
MIIFLLLIFQRRREDEKKRKEIELLTAKSQLDSVRDNLNRLRKNLYEVENRFNDDRFYHNAKKEELIQLVKKLKEVEEERDNLKKTIEEGAVDEKALNLLENRYKLIQGQLEEMGDKAKELQDEVTRREQSAKENEQKFKLLGTQISQTERELEQQKEIVKIKETRTRD